MLSKRLMVAIPLIIVLALVFLCPAPTGGWIFTLLALAAMGAAIHEAHTMMEGQKLDAFEDLLFILGACMIAIPLCHPARSSRLCMSPETTIHYVNFSRIFLWDAFALFAALFGGFGIVMRLGPTRENLTRLAAMVFNAVFIVWSLSFLVKLYFLPRGALYLAYLVLITKMADIGAYFIGTAASRREQGSHKLAPAVSPHKCWEGVGGGALFAIVGSLLFWAIAARSSAGFIRFGSALLMGVISPFAGLLGDLAESVLKRAADAKDSGHIPGLGGILDMLDSLLPMGVIFYMILAFGR